VGRDWSFACGPFDVPYQVQGRLTGCVIELASCTCAFDQTAPPLVPTVLTGDLTAAWERPVIILVGYRPLPRLPPQVPTRITPTTGTVALLVQSGRTVPRSLHVLVGTFAAGYRPTAFPLMALAENPQWRSAEFSTWLSLKLLVFLV
jgi:hypothetical protein